MIYSFPPIIQLGIAAGKYTQVITNSGVPIGMARDVVTGRFIAHATGIINNGIAINPLTFPITPALGVAQMYQSNRGFQATLQGINAIQSSLGVLQTTTALIGVSTAVGVGLTAVNLWQTLKLKQEVQQLKLEIKQGFLDIQNALTEQAVEVKEHLSNLSENLIFQQHRLELIKAYGRFIEATKLIKTAIKFQDLSSRKIELANARQILAEALAHYNNPNLLSESCAAGQIRRLECAWAIEQTIILTYQLQNEFIAVSDRLTELQDKIRQQCHQVIEKCDSYDQLDFLFPEIFCICDRDLLVLDTWQHQAEYIASLSTSELEVLEPTQSNTLKFENNQQELINLEKPIELIQYEDLQQKSHYHSLVDQLKFKVSPNLRKEYEIYISDRAKLAEHHILAKNISQASDMSLANLYWYFKFPEEFNRNLQVA
ncbi:hypothetical protein NIES4102_35300 [Chondrocystis sp. NIES-4102]|nr:hypothetical protein NIES4102_35300 [Chondrocystis sp. NIES-4102]